MLKLKIENTTKRFRVHVFNGADQVFECGWHGGEFIYAGEKYAVYGPYHGLDGDLFRVYKLVPVTEPK